MHPRALVMTLCLLLHGCSIRVPAAPAQTPGRVVLVRPYFPASRSAQALVPTKSVDDIATLYVVPSIDPGDGLFREISRQTGEPIEPSDAFIPWSAVVHAVQEARWLDMDRPIALTGLRPHARYRIMALAFDRTGTLISKEGEASSIELSLGEDEAPSVETPLPVQLVDTFFGAEATVQLSMTGNLNRLDRLEVSLRRLSDGQAALLPVATASVPAKQLPAPLRFSHLNAHTRYAVRIESRVTDGGAVPPPRTLEFEVREDDRLPDLEVAINVP